MQMKTEGILNMSQCEIASNQNQSMSQLTSTSINYCCDICFEDIELIVKKDI